MADNAPDTPTTQPWMAGANNGPTPPNSSPNEIPEAPILSDNTPPANVGGLAGAATQPAAPVQPAAPPPVPLHSKIAEGIIHAFAGTNGTAGDALRSAVSGGLAGLAAAASTPSKPGAPALGGFGIGANAGMKTTEEFQKHREALAQQAQENKDKQAQIDLAKQRESREGTQFDKDYQLRKQENARQQAESVIRGKEFEQRSVLVDQQIAAGKYDAVKRQADDLRFYSDRMSALRKTGGQQLRINGALSPSFDHLGDAKAFAQKNFSEVAHPDHATELIQNPDSGKWEIWEKKYEPYKDYEITDASGKKLHIFTDSTGSLAAQKQVAETKHYLNVAAKSSLDLKKDLEEFKEEGTVKGARKELNKVGGDISKLSPGSKSALTEVARNRFDKSTAVVERIEGKIPELRTPEENADLELYKSVRESSAKELADLTRPSFVPPPGSDAAKAAAAPKPNAAPAQAAPARPANVPSNFVHQNGPNGSGWYAPTAAPAPENAPSAKNPNPGNLQD
jgi:hypothetical protein